jgi:hypothetical protein
MALNPKFSTGFRDELLDGVDAMATKFANGFLDIFSGAQPADADTTEGAGTLLASVLLPALPFAAAAVSGAIAKLGTWEDTSANAAGTAAWFRLYDSAHTTGASTSAVRMDGTVGLDSGTFDLEFANIVFVLADPIVIDTFSVSINP